MNQVQAQFRAEFVARRARMEARAVADKPIALGRPSAFGTALALPMVVTRPAEVKVEPARQIKTVKGRHPPMSLILSIVSGVTGVAVRDIVGPAKFDFVVAPRQVVMFLAREVGKLSFSEIGRLIGNRDHTTAMATCRKLAEAQNEEPFSSMLRSARAGIDQHFERVDTKAMPAEMPVTPRRRREWSAEEDAFALQRRADGAKLDAIAAELGVTYGSLRHRFALLKAGSAS